MEEIDKSDERAASLGLRSQNKVRYGSADEGSDAEMNVASEDEEFIEHKVISSSSEEEQIDIVEDLQHQDYRRFSNRKRSKTQQEQYVDDEEREVDKKPRQPKKKLDVWNSETEEELEEENVVDSEVDNEDLLMEEQGEEEVVEYVRKIEKVLDFRKVPVPNEDYQVSEYLIKWNDASYYHVEWYELSELRGVPGYKKVVNFINTIQNPMNDLEPDDLEDLLIELEFNRGRLKDYQSPERILDVDEEERYLVKWSLLEYDQCTWEEGVLVSDIAQDKIDQFLVRQSSTTIPKNSKKYSKAKREKLILEAQPEYIPNTLRDYQLLGVNWMIYQWVNDQNGILADEMVDSINIGIR